MNRIFKPGKKDREYLFDKNEEEKRIDKRRKRKGRVLKQMAKYKRTLQNVGDPREDTVKTTQQKAGQCLKPVMVSI